MPNFECYGIPDDQIEEIKTLITLNAEREKWKDEWVVTIVQSEVVDKHNSKQPFIRIATTPEVSEDRLMPVINALINSGTDIELLMLSKFFPKKS